MIHFSLKTVFWHSSHGFRIKSHRKEQHCNQSWYDEDQRLFGATVYVVLISCPCHQLPPAGGTNRQSTTTTAGRTSLWRRQSRGEPGGNPSTQLHTWVSHRSTSPGRRRHKVAIAVFRWKNTRRIPSVDIPPHNHFAWRFAFCFLQSRRQTPPSCSGRARRRLTTVTTNGLVSVSVPTTGSVRGSCFSLFTLLLLCVYCSQDGTSRPQLWLVRPGRTLGKLRRACCDGGASSEARACCK